MARYNFRMQRLFVDHPLSDGTNLILDKGQSNYLINVLRMKAGDKLLVFNGREGEWLTELDLLSKKQAALKVVELIRPQPEEPDLHYLFAPLKQARLDYVVQKAVEMGVSHIHPVLTAHTQIHKVNTDRLRANVIEAAEQCGILHIPEVLETKKLFDVLGNWSANYENRALFFCDEGDEGSDPLATLEEYKGASKALLIGPEGGFNDEERTALRAQDFVVPISLGPRIMRADTAAVAALAIIQAQIGDWKS